MASIAVSWKNHRDRRSKQLILSHSIRSVNVAKINFLVDDLHSNFFVSRPVINWVSFEVLLVQCEICSLLLKCFYWERLITRPVCEFHNFFWLTCDWSVTIIFIFVWASQNLIKDVGMVLPVDLTISGTFEINFIDLVSAVLSTILLQSIELLFIFSSLEVTFLTPL